MNRKPVSEMEMIPRGIFDDAALSYDHDFSRSNIGSVLRKIVWEKLDKYLETATALNILEINCGTGEDAVYIGSKGHNVTATDQSGEMIKVAAYKNYLDNVLLGVLDFKDIDKKFNGNSFDIVFSNFGGLNCVNSTELVQVLDSIGKVLKPGGKFIGVIMGTACLWEDFYYLLKMDFKKFRRRKQLSGVPTIIGSSKFKTYYYSPADIHKMLPGNLSVISKAPVGLMVPPTYMEHYFRRHPKQLNFLSKIEEWISKVSWLANFADHYMIITEKEQ